MDKERFHVVVINKRASVQFQTLYSTIKKCMNFFFVLPVFVNEKSITNLFNHIDKKYKFVSTVSNISLNLLYEYFAPLSPKLYYLKLLLTNIRKNIRKLYTSSFRSICYPSLKRPVILLDFSEDERLY